jgi:hypothetical protein
MVIMINISDGIEMYARRSCRFRTKVNQCINWSTEILKLVIGPPEISILVQDKAWRYQLNLRTIISKPWACFRFPSMLWTNNIALYNTWCSF